METDRYEISKYRVVVPNIWGAGILSFIETPDVYGAPSNLSSIGRYVLTLDIFEPLAQDREGKFNWQIRQTSMLSRLSLNC